MNFQGFDQDKIEFYIVKSLLNDDLFARSFISKIHHALFSSNFQSLVKGYAYFYKKYNRIPPLSVLEDKLIPAACKNNENEITNAKNLLVEINTLQFELKSANEWLYEETKKFIKTRTIINAMIKCTEFVERGDHGTVVTIMEEAFKVDFDENFGLDYFDTMELRKETCNTKDQTYSTGIRSLDGLIGGGYRKKTLFVYAGPSGCGKTLFLNDAASTLALDGYNILYLSMELTEDYIARRTDAKFSEMKLGEIELNPRLAIEKAISKRNVLKKNGKKIGKLIYREFPPNAISSMDIEAMLKRYEHKHGITFDFIVVDYLKLVKPNGKTFSDNSYGRVGTVCEELRAVAMKHNIGVLTAAQTGRQSYNAKSIGMEDISDSMGIVHTADYIITLQQSTDMSTESTMALNVTKSRYAKRFTSTLVKADTEFMRIIDLSEDSVYVQHLNTKVNKSNEKKGINENRSIEEIENAATEDNQILDI